VTDLGIERSVQADGVVRVTLSGELDLASVPKLEAELSDIESSAPGVVLIDLGGLEFMDSSGLRALVMANDRAGTAGRRLAIVPGPPLVRRVFEITKLDQHLDLVEDASLVSAGDR
jgi:anti-sigma B factor antagonist